jgi:putative DNA methylase
MMTSLKAIEGDFPFEQLSEVAEVESWRKEVYRPIYHIHKWWARRLGSIFRAAILGAACSEEANIMDLFHKPTRLDGLIVFDPLMSL